VQLGQPEQQSEFLRRLVENKISNGTAEVELDDQELKNPFQIIGLKELLGRPPKEYLVQGLFGYDDHTMIVGDSGTGKSFFAIDIAVRGALGLPIAGIFPPARPFSTLYVTEEGVSGIPQRFEEACRLHGLDEGSEAFERIAFMDVVPKLFHDDSSEEGVDNFIKALNHLGRHFNLIIFDTLADVSEGSNEIDNGHIATINARARKIREAHECTTSYIHHTPKNGSGPRGGGAHRAKCDLVIEVLFDSGARTIHCNKLKDAPRFVPQAWELKQCGSSAVIEWLGNDRPTNVRSQKRDNIAEIVFILTTFATSEAEALTTKDIRGRMENPPSLKAVGDYIKELRADPGTIIRGKQIQVIDKNGIPNAHAWHYWADESEVRS
jgi:hypothetical protein